MYNIGHNRPESTSKFSGNINKFSGSTNKIHDTASGFTLPCVYCVNKSFPSSEHLKQHLLSSHSDLVAGTKKYVVEPQEDKNAKKFGARATTSDIRDYSFSKLTSRDRIDKISSTGSSVLSAPMHSEADCVTDFSDRKIKRLQENLKEKDGHIANLSKENERLKLEMTNKDEDHNRLRQRWRKEAEDAIRNLKTSYEDMRGQKQLLERQLNESEQEKNRVRNDNDKILKDHLDLQTQIAAEKRNLLQRKTSDDKISSMEKYLGKEKEMTKILSADLQNIRKENDNLAEAVTYKDDIIKKLQANIMESQNDIKNEKKKRDVIDRERLSLKGKLAMLEANAVQSVSDHELQKSNLESMTTKINKLEVNKLELMKKISSHNQTNAVLHGEITSLKDDKRKLVDNLHNADGMLSKLSHQVLTTKSTDQPINSPVGDEMKIHLEKILLAVKQISSRDTPASKQEITNFSSELQRVSLLLVEEKATVKELTSNIAELEECINSMEGNNGDSETYMTQLQRLRSKHQKCISNDKIRKQLKSEQRILNRKYLEVQQQHELLSVLFQSVKEELKHTDDMLKRTQKEKVEVISEVKGLTQEVENQRKEISERDVVLEKYKRESCYLLEKLNTATEELQKVKNTNEMLGQKLTDFSVVQSGIEALQQNVVKLNDSNQSLCDTNSFSNVEALLQKNVQLTSQVIQELQEKLADGELFLEIQQKNQQIQNESKTKINSKLLADYELKFENLSLEKEILSSRVLILESIREEMEQLRMEKEKIKEENKRLKETLKNQEHSSKTDLNKEEALVLINQYDENDGYDIEENNSAADFLENVKTLDELNDDDKTRLQEMLSMPDFQRFLSLGEGIDLHEDSDTSYVPRNDSIGNLSSENSEDEELIEHIHPVDSEPSLHTLNCGEFVQGMFECDVDQEIAEITVDYVKNENGTSCSDSQDDILKTEKNLEKIVSESKSISKIVSESKSISSDIARQNQGSGVNYKEVLKELSKVFDQVSSNINLDNRSKSKQVKFSEHVVEVFDGNNSNSSSTEEIPDSAFYKSFYQDALNKNYPQLNKNEEEEEDTHRDDSTTISCTSSMDLDQRTSSITSITSGSSSVARKASPSPSLKEQALEMIKANPRALTPPAEHLENIQRALSPSFEDKLPAIGSFQKSGSGLIASAQRYASCSESLFKGLGIMPQIFENERTNGKEISKDAFSSQPENSVNALNVLRTFIEKSDTIKKTSNSSESIISNSNNRDDVITPVSLDPLQRQNLSSLSTPGNVYDVPRYPNDHPHPMLPAGGNIFMHPAFTSTPSLSNPIMQQEVDPESRFKDSRSLFSNSET